MYTVFWSRWMVVWAIQERGSEQFSLLPQLKRSSCQIEGEAAILSNISRKNYQPASQLWIDLGGSRFLQSISIIKDKGSLKEGLKISYRKCGRCGCRTHLNYDDHMKECNEMFKRIYKQQKRLEAIEDSGRKFTASDVEVNDPKDERTAGFSRYRYYSY